MKLCVHVAFAGGHAVSADAAGAAARTAATPHSNHTSNDLRRRSANAHADPADLVKGIDSPFPLRLDRSDDSPGISAARRLR